MKPLTESEAETVLVRTIELSSNLAALRLYLVDYGWKAAPPSLRNAMMNVVEIQRLLGVDVPK